MKNEHIPPNPYPVKPPPNMPPPRKESLEAENARLKAENTRLKTEVEHLMVFCNCTLIPNKELQAKVERLTKSGDAMAEAMWYGDNGRSIWVKKFAETDWNAAKEGKQS